jgi:hypothetical protein
MKIKSYQIKSNDNSSTQLREIRQVFNNWVGKMLPNKQDVDTSDERTQNQKSNKSDAVNSDAVFIGWQKTPLGEAFPLYNVTAKNHPLYQSTVSDQTLREQNLKIPQTPHLQSDE